MKRTLKIVQNNQNKDYRFKIKEAKKTFKKNFKEMLKSHIKIREDIDTRIAKKLVFFKLHCKMDNSFESARQFFNINSLFEDNEYEKIAKDSFINYNKNNLFKDSVEDNYYLTQGTINDIIDFTNRYKQQDLLNKLFYVNYIEGEIRYKITQLLFKEKDYEEYIVKKFWINESGQLCMIRENDTLKILNWKDFRVYVFTIPPQKENIE